MKRVLISVLPAVITVLLQGCSSQPARVDQQMIAGEQLKNNQQIQQALFAAVQQTGAALESLSEIRRAQYPKQEVMPFLDLHDKALSKTVSIHWYGPISSIVNDIAKAVGFHYQEFGKPPELPVLVNINYPSASALVVLQNIELQANNKAAIKILPQQKIISLRYLTDD
ncbi:putative DotD protein [Piscirickettsia salmonis]|uniref:DotD/TraH family lipoprotein n=1 Tax=Piscirickettsia salmonis TaxID=1238 RepID=UPI0012B946CC|nr:DotD/TraH family lipoprotein [Piscirickettsia salmonis]QGP50582.1 putative DotD protein [Piscirickettsia salmonis]QGP54211.1 putative DotD protein [Piscirickettsia salmonis]QGP59890.1 putative DotD protein [Piscirickettsia salmonis]QGP63788.1 putative DotD protein [Piscirickettsia salmonis]